MKTYLVTSRDGFIGCNFINYMFKKYSDINIICSDKLTYYGKLENIKIVENNPKYSFI